MKREPPHRRSLIVVTVILGTVTVSLNNSALSPAIPTFMAAFDIGPATAGWVVNAFLLSMGATMPLTGYLAQRFSARRAYLAGLILFIGGSVAGALAEDIRGIIIARGIQGGGGGLMLPLSLALIFSAYPRQRRGAVTGVWAAIVTLPPALGPLIGGLSIEHWRWPILFIFNLPAALTACLLGFLCLPREPGGDGCRFDWPGFFLVTLSVSTLLLALAQSNDSASLLRPTNPLLIAAAAVSMIFFVRVERRAAQPLLNLNLFSSLQYTLSVAVAVALSIGGIGTLLLLPLLLQTALGFNATTTGLALMTTAACASVTVKVAGKILDVDGPRRLVALGLALSALANIAFAGIDGNSALWHVFTLSAIRGMGLGLAYIPITTAGLNAIPEQQVTQGSTINNLCRRLMTSIAIVATSIYLEVRQGYLVDRGYSDSAGTLTALGELFIAVGVLLALCLPLAALLPSSERYTRRSPLRVNSS